MNSIQRINARLAIEFKLYLARLSDLSGILFAIVPANSPFAAPNGGRKDGDLGLFRSTTMMKTGCGLHIGFFTRFTKATGVTVRKPCLFTNGVNILGLSILVVDLNLFRQNELPRSILPYVTSRPNAEFNPLFSENILIHTLEVPAKRRLHAGTVKWINQNRRDR